MKMRILLVCSLATGILSAQNAVPPPPRTETALNIFAGTNLDQSPNAEASSASAPAPTNQKDAKPKPIAKLSDAPALTPIQPTGPDASGARAEARDMEKVQPITQMKATLVESNFPQVVRKDGAGYIPVNVPPGWRMVPLRTLKFEPSPVIKLASGETFEVESSPFALVPATDSVRTSINPRALQVIHNFYLAQMDLLQQMRTALAPPPTTPIQ